MSMFFVSLNKELLDPTFSACLNIVLDSVCKFFGCSAINDFISTVSKVFDW